MPDKEKSYEDENLTDDEKEGGRLRQPSPKEEPTGTGADTRLPCDQPASPMRRSYFGQFSGQRHGASGARSSRQKRATSPLA